MTHIAARASPKLIGRAILVVEDEVFIRAVICDLLREAGARVIEAENADEALKCVAMDPTVGVVFTDVRMPGSLDGLQMRDRIASLHPHIKTVITSGHLLPHEMPDGALFFIKPYSVENVAAQLILLVDQSSNEHPENG
jgi:DNA-binding NtrC family response regulator